MRSIFRIILLISLIVLVACNTAQDDSAIPTMMVLDTATSTRGPSGPTATPLPEVVGVPTPTPPNSNLGTFIAKLSSGETLDQAFNETSLRHVYVFDGLAGQYATIAMNRVAGLVDPVLTLYSPSGMALATDDNSGGGRDALIRNVYLPEDGLYSLLATGDGQVGHYQIHPLMAFAPFAVTPDFGDAPVTPTRESEALTPTLATAISGTQLESHVPVIGTFDTPGGFQRYPIFAVAGDVLTISASPLPGSDLPLKIEVFGPAGDLVASAASSTSETGQHVMIWPLHVESTGAYVVFVTTEQPAVGQYSIAYGTGSTYENVMRGEALPDVVNDGQISQQGLRDVWSMYLSEGDIIMAAVSPTSGSLDPIVEIARAGSDDVLAIDDNGGSDRNALIPSLRIRQSGLYHIQVKAAQGNSTGNYALVWRFINRIPTATPVTGRVTLLSVDDSVAIDTYAFYPFQGFAGQQIEIRVDAQSSEGFDPVAVLLGPDGTIVAEGDDSGDTLNPYILAQIPADGTYTVRVNGYLSGGAFELSVNELY